VHVFAIRSYHFGLHLSVALGPFKRLLIIFFALEKFSELGLCRNMVNQSNDTMKGDYVKNGKRGQAPFAVME